MSMSEPGYCILSTFLKSFEIWAVIEPIVSVLFVCMFTLNEQSYSIVFIHGLWMHSSTWKPWMQFFAQHGYESLNPDWPGDAATVEESRANKKAIANHGIKEVADGYAKVISTLPSKPILIGHSFGGLMVQILLGKGLGAAGIAIDPAPIKGVWQLPLSALKASFPVLGNPFNITKAVSLTHQQFHYAFTNRITEEESQKI